MLHLLKILLLLHFHFVALLLHIFYMYLNLSKDLIRKSRETDPLQMTMQDYCKSVLEHPSCAKNMMAMYKKRISVQSALPDEGRAFQPSLKAVGSRLSRMRLLSPDPRHWPALHRCGRCRGSACRVGSARCLRRW